MSFRGGGFTRDEPEEQISHTAIRCCIFRTKSGRNAISLGTKRVLKFILSTSYKLSESFDATLGRQQIEM